MGLYAAMGAGAPVGEAHIAALTACFGCNAETARGIAAHARHDHHPARTPILGVGDDCDDGWVMLLGEAHAFVYSAAGQLVLIHRFADADLFGPATGLPATSQEAEIVAVQPCDVGRFRGVDFILLTERHACVANAVTRALVRRLRETTMRMVEASTLSANGRVHAELLRRATDNMIRPAPVLSELALVVQSTRETVSRAINALERAGIIRRTAEELTIVAPHRLEELVY